MNKIDSNFSEASSLLGSALQRTGIECLNEIARVARDQFGARTVGIGSLRIAEAEHLFVEVISSGIPDLQLNDFATRNTACHDVLIADDFVAVLDKVAEKYPDSPTLKTLNPNGFVGCPLTDSRGNCLGVLALEWPDAIPASLFERIKEVLGPYLPRISEELRRITTAHAIETMISPTGRKAINGIEIFRTIVKQAAELSGVHTVLLAKNCDDNPSAFKILTAYSNGSAAPNLEGTPIQYLGTPCEKLLNCDRYFHERDLSRHFPSLNLIRDVGGQSYLGFGFGDSEGNAIGHIAFLHNRPMSPRIVECPLMQMISSRAGMELQRFDLELERNAMETALRVRSKLESLGIMAGTIAHDFNNQLAAMIGNTELALMETPSEYPATEYLEAAEESMWRARDVIGELMDFAGNNTSAELEPMALGEIVSSSISEFRSLLNGATTIRSSIDENLPNIMGRRVQLIQILSNLIANGLDAAAREGAADIEIRVAWTNRAKIRHEKCLTGHSASFPDRCIVLEVRDSGRGMDSETAERAFDPYFSTKGISRGLGLSSVLGLCKRLGIGLTFESKPDQGTVFRLYFKDLAEGASIQREQVPASSGSTSEGFNRKSILVVDDDPGVQDMVIKFVKNMGHDVYRASSGEEALAVAREIPNLDLAIVDVVMPGMNGFETVSELRKSNHGLPAVLVSGFSERNLSDSFVQDETTKFLLKPFSIKKVSSIISELVH